MKKIAYLLVFAALALGGCKEAPKNEFVRVEDGNFMIGSEQYRFIGCNFWYGAILGSTGPGGDRERLTRELDFLKDIGVDNLRVLVGADGPDGIAMIAEPSLQIRPGEYNDDIFDGLDWLLAEMGKRGMYAVLYVNNGWEWSGGFSQYMNWTGAGPIPMPADGYNEYCDYAGAFSDSSLAQQMFEDHLRRIITRSNRYTGLPYRDDPAIMSWQICNEPRPFGRTEERKENFAAWIARAARIIRENDPNHLISTGSEGYYGCEWDIDFWEQIHSDPNIDFLTVHIWPYNWGWIDVQDMPATMPAAIEKSDWYLGLHLGGAARMGKPIVIEEFGFPRDGMNFAIGTAVKHRDMYYEHIFRTVADNVSIGGPVQGCNFWAWGGFGEPHHEMWQAGDDYTGDPAQEAQGLNSVFATDSKTVKLIAQYNRQISAALAAAKNDRL